MKMKVTYEQADIKRLIRNNLARQGIVAREEDIEFDKKGQAVISVEVSADNLDPESAGEPSVITSSGAMSASEYATQTPPAPTPTPPPVEKAPPKLEAIEGGQNPVDMSGILRASAENLRDRPAPFPSPKPGPHAMLEGESYDFPTDK